MKNQKQLIALIEVARAENARGALKGHTAGADDASSTNSWGPQMRV